MLRASSRSSHLFALGTAAVAWLVLVSIAAHAHAQVPLDQPGPSYLGQFELGLYPGGNTMPAAHQAEGLARSNAIAPRDNMGVPSASGKVVLLSIGGTDASQEFCTSSLSNPPDRTATSLQCTGHSLMGRVYRGGYGNIERVDTASLSIVNGAYADQLAANWEHDTTPFANVPSSGSTPIVTGNYTRIRDNVLGRYTTPLSESQVQVVWLKVWNGSPSVGLPSATADAYALEQRLGNIVRLLKQRYPNLVQVFISSPEYAGYSTGTLSAEPYAYEAGFAVKWLIEAQIVQMSNGSIDARAGDLNYSTGVAPWLAWGPYLWADGLEGKPSHPNWVSQDFDVASLSTYKSVQGQSKVGLALTAFFTFSPFTKCWFMLYGACR